MKKNMVNIQSHYEQMRQAGWSASKIVQQVALDWEDIYSSTMYGSTTHAAAAYDRVDEAAAAVARARHTDDVGRWTLKIVQEQAVFACLAKAMTIREITEYLGLKKRIVKRIVKRIAKDLRPSRTRRKFDDDASIQDATYRSVVAAWGAPRRLSIEEIHNHARRLVLPPRHERTNWSYFIKAHMFPGDDTATRDSIVMALRQSAWMADELELAGSEDTCTLWGLAEELHRSENVADYDALMMALYDFADLRGCRIEFIDPSNHQGRQLEREAQTSR